MSTEITLTTDGLLLNWLKSVGEPVTSGEIVAEVEADKATFEIESPADGVLLEVRAEVGDELAEGAVIGLLGEPGEVTESAVAPQPEAEPSTPTPAPEPSTNGASSSAMENGRLKASPVARRVAEERGIDLTQVTGTGPNGRIVKSDVENFTPSAAPAAASSTSSSSTGMAIAGQTWGDLPSSEGVEIIDVSRMRRAIAENTILSKQQVPHFYVTTEIDVAELLKLRKQLNAELAEDGIKISVNDMVVKATAITLRRFPNLNSHFYGDKIVRFKDINVGIAVALPDNGLMNVVSHNADKVALSEMAVQHKEMFARAREGKVKPNDLKGATFTVSNLGSYDVDVFSAIISPPEAGIIAVGTAKQVPVVLEDGTLGIGSRMKVTISVDHRVSDGAEGAEWLRTFKGLIENPVRLLV